MVLRARDDQRVRRRAESGIDGIDLDPGGAALQQAEIADDLALDAREDEGGTGIARGIGAAVIGRVIEALADEADPRQRIGRAALAPPQPAVLAGEAVVVLADLGVPGAGAILAAPHLDDAIARRMIGDAPVEAVAAHIHQPSAAPDPAVERVEHGERIVFRMTAGQQDAVRADEIEPFLVQIVVGDDVEGKAAAVEPVDDEEIAAIIPPPPGRANIGRRAMARGVADAAAVGVAIIGRVAHLGMLEQQDVDGVEHGEPALGDLGHHRAEAADIVLIDGIGGGRGEVDDVGASLALGRTDEEGDLELRLLRRQPRGIAAAPQAGGNREGEIRLPARIGDVVVVEMDGAVLHRRVAPVHLAAVPVVPGHGARRQVYGGTVEAIG